MMPDKIWVYYGPNVTEVYNEKDADSTPYHRAPTTLDEAMRDYAMFGEFVATRWNSMTQEQMFKFQARWVNDEYTESFVAFVKEEMGK